MEQLSDIRSICHFSGARYFVAVTPQFHFANFSETKPMAAGAARKEIGGLCIGTVFLVYYLYRYRTGFRRPAEINQIATLFFRI